MVQQIVVKDRKKSLQYAATRTIKASWPDRTSLATKTERASWTKRPSRASPCSNYSTAFVATIKTRSTKAISRLRAQNAVGKSRYRSRFPLPSIALEITRITLKITGSVAKSWTRCSPVSKGACVKI